MRMCVQAVQPKRNGRGGRGRGLEITEALFRVSPMLSGPLPGIRGECFARGRTLLPTWFGMPADLCTSRRLQKKKKGKTSDGRDKGNEIRLIIGLLGRVSYRALRDRHRGVKRISWRFFFCGDKGNVRRKWGPRAEFADERKWEWRSSLDGEGGVEWVLSNVQGRLWRGVMFSLLCSEEVYFV